MLATRKLNSSGSFSDQLRNPSARFGGVLGERFPKAIDKSLGNGYHLGHGRGETLAAGFLLLDATHRPIYASEEALAILAYPGVPSKIKGFDNFLQNRIQLLFANDGNHNGFTLPKFLSEVASGKRRYQLRAFSVKASLGVDRRPAVALLLERNQRGAFSLESAMRKFRLTRRETETVELLLQDLSTKHIASRMDISPSTAKAFLRSVMIKVGAENRTGIIARLLQASKAMNGEGLL